MPYSIWDRIIPLLIVVGSIAILVGVPIAVIRSARRRGEHGFAAGRRINDARAGCYTRMNEAYEKWERENPHADPGPEVEITFHTYSGNLFYVTQIEHREVLPCVAAEMLVKELHRFNFLHGPLTKGAFWIPLLSWFSYRAQLKQVRRARGQ